MDLSDCLSSELVASNLLRELRDSGQLLNSSQFSPVAIAPPKKTTLTWRQMYASLSSIADRFQKKINVSSALRARYLEVLVSVRLTIMWT